MTNKAVVLLFALLAAMIYSPSDAVPVVFAFDSADDRDKPHPREKTLVKRRWGIEVIGVRRIAAGFMLSFRYRVIDPEKAKPVFVRRSKPTLIHEETGAEFIVPAPNKTGPLRNSNIPQANRIYWMAFANPAKFVQSGDRVSIEIGDFRVKGLVVE